MAQRSRSQWEGLLRLRISIIVLGVALAAAAAYGLPLGQWVTDLAQGARATGSLGVGLFFVAYVASTVAGLPGSILTLALGFAYGPFWGLVIASPASVTGATCAFFLGRTLLRDWAAKKAAGSARARAIEAAVEREGLKLVLLLRLSPVVPFNLLNYMLSVTSVRLSTYVLASAVGMLPGTALYVYLGSLAPAAAELSSVAQTGGSARTALYIIGLLATVAVVVVGTRAARGGLAAELQRPSS
jgi:uncharacterized membrane protein YdjX (TVP38/TMEM64 family)